MKKLKSIFCMNEHPLVHFNILNSFLIPQSKVHINSHINIYDSIYKGLQQNIALGYKLLAS